MASDRLVVSEIQSFGRFYAVAVQLLGATSAISSTSCHCLRLLDHEPQEPRSLELKRRLKWTPRDFLSAKHLVFDAELYSVDSGTPG